MKLDPAFRATSVQGGADPVVSVVAPVFNEQDNVLELVQRVSAVLDALGKPYEIILVDDGSRDATWERVSALSLEHPAVSGLRLARNFGHQAALLAGLSAARGRAVVSMDGDLQHPPELIASLVAAWENGAAVVETRRRYGSHASRFKRLTSSWFYRVFSAVSDVSIEPGMSDFRLLDRRALVQLLRFQQSDIFLRGAVGWLDFPSTTIEFEAADRSHGQSKFTLARMLRFARTGLVAFSTRPLRIGIGLGLLTSLVSFAYLIYIVVQFFRGATVPGWASTLGLLSLLFGVLFVMLGIIGGYVGHIYVMLQNRPAYVVLEETASRE